MSRTIDYACAAYALAGAAGLVIAVLSYPGGMMPATPLRPIEPGTVMLIAAHAAAVARLAWTAAFRGEA